VVALVVVAGVVVNVVMVEALVVDVYLYYENTRVGTGKHEKDERYGMQHCSNLV
jgi:hypothetical protein